MVEFLGSNHNYCTGSELKNHIPHFQGLNQAFYDIATTCELSIISFGVKTDTELVFLHFLVYLDHF